MTTFIIRHETSVADGTMFCGRKVSEFAECEKYIPFGKLTMLPRYRIPCVMCEEALGERMETVSEYDARK